MFVVLQHTRAAWWGGKERLIRIVRDCLTKTVKSTRLPVLGFLTVIKEIEAVVNSRPLTVLPDSPFLPEALTPGHFTTGWSSLSLPAGAIKASGERDDPLCKLWRPREKLLNDFWIRWKNEYLLLLGSVHKRRNSRCSPLAVGDIVLINDDNLPRLKWKLGRIEEVLKGKDNVCRSCKVKTEHGVLLRTFEHLYKLL